MFARIRMSPWLAAIILPLSSCGATDERPPRTPLIKVEFEGKTHEFILNEEAECGTLEDGTPYVEAKWYRQGFEKEPPFYIKGEGGWEGTTYTEPHTWIHGFYETENGSQTLGFAIHGDDRPGFDDDDKFYWSGPTGVSGDMTVEVICP